MRRRLIADLECAQSPRLCNLLQHHRLLRRRPSDTGPWSSRRQGVFRHPRPLLGISQSRMREGEARGRQRSTNGKARTEKYGRNGGPFE